MIGLSLHFTREMGIGLPETVLESDQSLGQWEYVIELRSSSKVAGRLEPGRLLAVGSDEAMGPLLGMTTVEPVYGMPGKWILPAQVEQALELGCVVFDPVTLIATHLTELIGRELHHLLDFDDVANRLDRLANAYPALAGEARRRLPVTGTHRLLRELLRDRVSIADLRSILEAVVNTVEPGHSSDPALVTSLVRSEIGAALCAPLVGDDGVLQVVTLSDGAEAAISKHTESDAGLPADLGERLLRSIASELGKVMEQGLSPILLVGFDTRHPIRELTRRVFPDTPVLSWTEIPETVEVVILAVVGSRFHPSARSMPSERWRVGAGEASTIPGV